MVNLDEMPKQNEHLLAADYAIKEEEEVKLLQ